MNMKLLANLSLKAFRHTNFFYKHVVVKTCQIYDLLTFSGFSRTAQVFHSHVLATTLADHVSRSRIMRDGSNGFPYDFHVCVVH